MGAPKRLRRLKRAARRGQPYALYALGRAYEAGRFVREDHERAAVLMEAAAALGYAPAVAWCEAESFDDNAAVQAES